MRNRAKEIVNLLEDNNQIVSERKKASENRNKYIGVSSQGGSSFDRYDDYSSNSYRSTEVQSTSDNIQQEYVSARTDFSSPQSKDNKEKNELKSSNEEGSLLNFDEPVSNSKHSNDDFAEFQSADSSVPIQSQKIPSQDLFSDFESPSLFNRDKSISPVNTAPVPFHTKIESTPHSIDGNSAKAANESFSFANFETVSKPTVKKVSLSLP